MTDDIQFSRSARRPMPTVKASALQWSTGLTTTKRSIYAGWLVEAGKDETLDQAMHAAGYEAVTIKHGSGNLVTHWAVETANVFVLADGVQSLHEIKATAERCGIAFRWNTLPDGRPQSKLTVQVLLRDLLDIGYDEPLLLTVKSTLTGDMLAALTRQYDVLDAIDALRTQQGKPALNPPFYACSIEIGPGDEVQRGQVQKKAIIPPVARIPDPITREYLVEHYVRQAWVAPIETRMRDVHQWSTEYSKQDEEAPTAEPASEKQRTYIAILQDKLAWHSEQLAAYAQEQGVDLVMLTTKQASEFIEGMQRLVDEHSVQPAPVVATAKADNRPKSLAEAKARFYSRFGVALATFAECPPVDLVWGDVCNYLNKDIAEPTTIDAYIDAARLMLAAQTTAQAA